MKQFIINVLSLFLFHSSFCQENVNFVDSVGQNIEGTELELVKIKEDYYVVQPAGIAGNVGVYVGMDGVVLIDSQWSKLIPRIKELLRTVTDKPINYIINTHFHFDHVDGNKIFGKEKVPIIAHRNLRARLSADQVITGSPYGAIVQKAYSPEALPSIVFGDSMELHDGKETIRILHFPNAHTDGDAIVHFKNANIYHTGDIFVTYGLPVLDENNGGDVYAMISAIQYLLSLSNIETRVIPGHGSVCTFKELSEYLKMLTSIRDQVAKMVRNGIKLDKVLSGVVIDENVGGLDKEQFVAHVYRMALKHEKPHSEKKPK